MVIRHMVRQFNLNVDIVGVDTRRAPDGLAMSSRNGYLSEDERAQAPQLHAALQQVAHAVRAGNTDFEALRVKAVDTLTAKGWQADYVEIKRQADLGAPEAGPALVVLAAAKLGKTRLIDNLEI
jgi:pantoate--beta-alanine ligase